MGILYIILIALILMTFIMYVAIKNGCLPKRIKIKFFRLFEIDTEMIEKKNDLNTQNERSSHNKRIS